jgi:hypothetical protein
VARSGSLRFRQWIVCLEKATDESTQARRWPQRRTHSSGLPCQSAGVFQPASACRGAGTRDQVLTQAGSSVDEAEGALRSSCALSNSDDSARAWQDRESRISWHRTLLHPDPLRNGWLTLPRFGREVWWLYLAGILDLFSRRGVGRAMAATQDERLVPQALQMAWLAVVLVRDFSCILTAAVNIPALAIRHF